MPSENLIYETLLKQSEALGAMAAKLEAVDEKVGSVLEQTTKTNGRVTVLERWKWKATGMGTVAGAIVVGLYQWFTGK